MTLPLSAGPAALADGFGLALGDGAGLTRIQRGAVGVVWRLDTGLGSTFAVKELLWGGDEHEVRREVAFRDAATARGLVDAPASHPAPGGAYLVEIGTAQVRLYDWVAGQVVTPGQPGLARWLGTTLGGLHGLAHPIGEAVPHPWYRDCPDPATWRPLLAADAPWAAGLRAALPRIEVLTELAPVPRGQSYVYCHLDLRSSNVFARPGGTGFALLDWDNAGPGNPEQELAATLVAWYVLADRVDGAGIAEMMAAYLAAGGPAVELSPGSLRMAVATSLNYLEIQARLALDTTASAEHRDFAEQACLAMLATLPDPAALTRALSIANTALRACD